MLQPHHNNFEFLTKKVVLEKSWLMTLLAMQAKFI